MRFSTSIILALALSFTSIKASPTPQSSSLSTTEGNSSTDRSTHDNTYDTHADLGPAAEGNPTPNELRASKGSKGIEVKPQHHGGGLGDEAVRLKGFRRGLVVVGSGTPDNPSVNSATAGKSGFTTVSVGPGTTGNPAVHSGVVEVAHVGVDKDVGYGPGTPSNSAINSVGVLPDVLNVGPGTADSPTPNQVSTNLRRQDDGGSDEGEGNDESDNEAPEPAGDDEDSSYDDQDQYKRAIKWKPGRPTNDTHPGAGKAQPNKAQPGRTPVKPIDSTSHGLGSGSNAAKELAAAMNQIKGRSRRRGLTPLAQGDVCLEINAINNPACSSPAGAGPVGPLNTGSSPSDDDPTFDGAGSILAIKPASDAADDTYLLGAMLGVAGDSPVVEVLPVGHSGPSDGSDDGDGDDDSLFGGLGGFALARPAGVTSDPVNSVLGDDSLFGGIFGFAPVLTSASPSSTSSSSAADSATSSATSAPAATSSGASSTELSSSNSETASPSSASSSDSTTPSPQPTGQVTEQAASSTASSSSTTSSAISSAPDLSISVSLSVPTGVQSVVPSAVATQLASDTPATGLVGSLPQGTVPCPSSLGFIHESTDAVLGQLVTLCIDVSLLNATPDGTIPCSDPANLINDHVDNNSPSLLSRVLGSRSRFTGLTGRARSARRNGDLFSLCVEAGIL